MVVLLKLTMSNIIKMCLVIAVIVGAGMIFVHTFVEAVVYSPEGDMAAPQAETSIDSAVSAQESADSLRGFPVPDSTPMAVAAAKPVPKSKPKPPASHPARLSVPVLAIDAAVQNTGISAKGNIGVPTNFSDVAWYASSAVPGQIGTAIMDGHVDNGLGLAGVFKSLSAIHSGDDMYVTTYGGDKIRFIVTDVSLYEYENVPLSSILSKDDDSYLVLITCEGDWVSGDRTYNERLVVTAKKF